MGSTDGAISENIRAMRRLFDLSQADVASIAGVTRGAVASWEHGRAEPRMGAIQRLADHLHIYKSNIIEKDGMRYVDPITHEAHPALQTMAVSDGGEATVPLVTLGRVHAGPFTNEEVCEVSVEIPTRLMTAHPNAQALIVEGDCMDMVAPEGMAVIYDPDMEPSNGDIAIVETADYQAVMREWYRGSDYLMLVARSHAQHDDIIIRWDEGPIKVLGVVFWIQTPRELA